jgi:Glycerophosphoryl diester phosphodiesterase family
MFGKVLVAHDPQQLRPGKTLEKLYLEPLRKHLQANQGRLFSSAAKLYLFIDVKTPARQSYNLLHHLLQRYEDIVTRFTPEQATDQPVTMVISGNRLPYEVMQEQRERYAVLDGRLEDLDAYPHLTPFISDDWQKHFRWQGHAGIPSYELEHLQRSVRTAHQHGQKVRFWGTPDKPSNERENLWRTLLEQGVDLISTDDVTGLRDFSYRINP